MSNDTYKKLKKIMKRWFMIENVLPKYASSFQQELQKRIGKEDHKIENYNSPDYQREMSVRFHWGHDHDFEEFFLEGQMGDRHLSVIADFIDRFSLPMDLTGTKILDVGVWTGGTSLLLSALGAEVTAVEEVVKYCDTVNYLAECFGIESLRCRPVSLFDIDDHDKYNFVVCSGVINHVTDPVIFLRILFNSLKNGGKIFIETLGGKVNKGANALAFIENSRCRKNSVGKTRKDTWNYFIPSPGALEIWMSGVGFEDIEVSGLSRSRIMACGTRICHWDFLRSGLSRPNIR